MKCVISSEFSHIFLFNIMPFSKPNGKYIFNKMHRYIILQILALFVKYLYKELISTIKILNTISFLNLY